MKQFLLSFPLLMTLQIHAQQYHLLWEDNFDSLNTSIWKVQNNFDHYGGELQVYTDRPENVFIEDGSLILRVLKEEYTCPPEALNTWGCARQYNIGEPYQYTSGWIETQPAYNTLYGKIEARTSLPWGRGFWPAYWTFVGEGLSTNVNAAEIDIFEMYGNKPSTLLSTNVHLEYCNPDRFDYPDCNSIPSYGKEHVIPSYANKYHVYTIEWSPEYLKWKMDGIPLRVMNNPGVVDPVRTIINMAIQAGNPPTVNTPFPSDIKIDYVKVYAPGGLTAVSSNTVSKDDLKIYPVPAGNRLYIEQNTAKNIQINSIEILDVLGRQVSSDHTFTIEDQSIDVSSLVGAQYVLKINTDKGSVSMPFVKL